MPDYDYQKVRELVWAVLAAMALPVAVALATVEVDAVTNWRLWMYGVVVAAVRAGGGALLAWLTTRKAS